ncbi:MAG: hypothetical protein MHM6MM_001374 [Cercozoa sp. M6MM]
MITTEQWQDVSAREELLEQLANELREEEARARITEAHGESLVPILTEALMSDTRVQALRVIANISSEHDPARTVLLNDAAFCDNLRALLKQLPDLYAQQKEEILVKASIICVGNLVASENSEVSQLAQSAGILTAAAAAACQIGTDAVEVLVPFIEAVQHDEDMPDSLKTSILSPVIELLLQQLTVPSLTVLKAVCDAEPSNVIAELADIDELVLVFVDAQDDAMRLASLSILSKLSLSASQLTSIMRAASQHETVSEWQKWLGDVALASVSMLRTLSADEAAAVAAQVSACIKIPHIYAQLRLLIALRSMVKDEASARMVFHEAPIGVLAHGITQSLDLCSKVGATTALHLASAFVDLWRSLLLCAANVRALTEEQQMELVFNITAVLKHEVNTPVDPRVAATLSMGAVLCLRFLCLHAAPNSLCGALREAQTVQALGAQIEHIPEDSGEYVKSEVSRAIAAVVLNQATALRGPQVLKELAQTAANYLRRSRHAELRKVGEATALALRRRS